MSLKLVTIGGSAGSIQSLIEIMKQLPAKFDAAICIVVHISPHSTSLLPQIFAAATPLPVAHAKNGQTLKAGHIYIAPPDHHLLIRKNTLEVVRGAKENHHRPAIDPLFRSASVYFGSRHTAVLLSGYLDDGTAGLIEVRNSLGTIIIQDPDDTMYPDMLRNALQYVEPDHIAPLPAIIPLLVAHLEQATSDTVEPMTEAAAELEMVKVLHGDSRGKMPGKPVGLVCPECTGPLWEINDKRSQLIRFRCHEGHAYSPLSLAASQNDSIEVALWSALRALDEKAELAKKLSFKAEAMGQDQAMHRFIKQFEKTKSQANLIRQVLEEGMTQKESD